MSTEAFPAAPSGVCFGPPPDWVILRPRDDTFRAPTGASESYLLIDHQFHAGKREAYTRLARRFETPAAVQQGSQWRHDFDPATQSINIHSIAVCRGDERMEQGKEARVRVLQREENLERLMLDGTMTVVLLLDDVRVGDVLDVSYTITTKPRIFAEQFAAFLVVPTWCHARSFHVRVQFPAAMPMQWRSDSSDLQVQKQELAGGDHEWSWEVKGIKPIEPEPATPSWVLPGAFLQLSTFADWAAVAEGIDAAWKTDFEHSELQKCVQVIERESTVLQRIEKAFQWAQDDLRYLSVNTELGGQIPTNPGEVLQRRFGDCKDKSFLLAHLLRLLGVPARPVLVNAVLRQRVREFLPSANVFNHAIVEFEYEGRRRWVDATIPFQGGGPLCRNIPGFGFGLPIGPGVTDLEAIAAPPKLESHYESREILRIEGRETLHVTVMTRATGRFADDLRYRHAFEGATETARAREQFYQSGFPNARRASDPETRDNREENEFCFVESFSMRWTVIPIEQGRAGGFQFPAHLMQRFLGFPEMEKRTRALALPEPCSLEQRIECEFPTLMQTGTQAVSVSTSEFSFDGKCRQAGDRTTFAFSLRIKAEHVEVDKYAVHRWKAIESLRSTRLTIYLPANARSMGPRRPPATLLPAPSPVSRREEALAPAAIATRPVAPVLATRDPSARVLEERADATPTPRPKKQAKAASAVTMQPIRKRKRRSKRKGRLQKPVVWITIILVVIGTAIVLVRNLSH